MKITVIGSTSSTGMNVLEAGMKRGHEMIAFSRRPQLLQGLQGLHAVIHGDGLHLSDMQAATDGADAVIAIVGGKSKEGDMVPRVISHLIESIHITGVNRLMFVSSYLIGTKRPRLVSSIARRFFRSELAELHAAEKLIQQCDLDWTIIRPTQLNNAAATGKVRIQKQGLDFTSGPYQVSRADLAQVLLDTAETSVHNRKILQVTWGK